MRLKNMLKSPLALFAALLLSGGAAGAAEPFTCPKGGDTFIRVEVQPGSATVVEMPKGEPLLFSQETVPHDTVVKLESGGRDYMLCVARVEHADTLHVLVRAKH